MNQKNINKLIEKELAKAKKKHPNFPIDRVYAAAIIAEECGELIQACNDFEHGNRYDKNNNNNMIEEAAHVIVTCIRFLERMEVS